MYDRENLFWKRTRLAEIDLCAMSEDERCDMFGAVGEAQDDLLDEPFWSLLVRWTFDELLAAGDMYPQIGATFKDPDLNPVYIDNPLEISFCIDDPEAVWPARFLTFDFTHIVDRAIDDIDDCWRYAAPHDLLDPELLKRERVRAARLRDALADQVARLSAAIEKPERNAS